MSWLRATAATIWQWLVHPRRYAALPAPTEAQLQTQPAGSLWCGPAVAVTLTRMLAPPGVDLEAAKAALLGVNGLTNAGVLAGYLNDSGLLAAYNPLLRAKAAEIIEAALTGGAYCVASVLTYGPFSGLLRDSPATHFFIVHGLKDGRFQIADSIDRFNGHFYTVSALEFPLWLAKDFADLIIVRKRA